MDGVTAIGLASAIVTLVSVGTKIANRLKDLTVDGDIPGVFRDVQTRLPLMISIVVRIQHETDNLSPEARVAFEEVVNRCYRQATQLERILEKVKIVKGDSRTK